MKNGPITHNELLRRLGHCHESWITEHGGHNWLLTPYYGVRLNAEAVSRMKRLWAACNLPFEPMQFVATWAITAQDDQEGRSAPGPLAALARLVAADAPPLSDRLQGCTITAQDGTGRVVLRRREDGTWAAFDRRYVRTVERLGLAGTWRQATGRWDAPAGCWTEDGSLLALQMPVRLAGPITDSDLPPELFPETTSGPSTTSGRSPTEEA